MAKGQYGTLLEDILRKDAIKEERGQVPYEIVLYSRKQD